MAAMPIYYADRKLPGMDAVKFTKRDLTEEMTVTQWNEPYPGEHSFGRTYGEHRQALELTDRDHAALYLYAKSKGLDFVETICSIGALSLLDLFVPDYIKVASRDMDNIPLLKAIGDTKLPVILSSGMSDLAELREAVDAIGHDDIAILHCVSTYPCPYDDANLDSIDTLRREFPGYRIGYSDHTTGILAPALSVVHGAEIVEKHITLDRQMRGSDHRGSLGLEGLWRCVRDVRNAEISAGAPGIYVEPSTAKAQKRLRRSVCTAKPLESGDYFTEYKMLSPGTGIPYKDRDKVLGKRARHFIPAMEIVREEDVW